jgi:hypothetical protein
VTPHTTPSDTPSRIDATLTMLRRGRLTGGGVVVAQRVVRGDLRGEDRHDHRDNHQDRGYDAEGRGP